MTSHETPKPIARRRLPLLWIMVEAVAGLLCVVLPRFGQCKRGLTGARQDPARSHKVYAARDVQQTNLQNTLHRSLIFIAAET